MSPTGVHHLAVQRGDLFGTPPAVQDEQIEVGRRGKFASSVPTEGDQRDAGCRTVRLRERAVEQLDDDLVDIRSVSLHDLERRRPGALHRLDPRAGRVERIPDLLSHGLKCAA